MKMVTLEEFARLCIGRRDLTITREINDGKVVLVEARKSDGSFFAKAK